MRDFNAKPRRVVVTLEFDVYDDVPVDQLVMDTEMMLDDNSEDLMQMFGSAVCADSSLVWSVQGVDQ